MNKFMRGLGQNKGDRLRKCKPFILLFCVLFAFVTVLGSTMAWFTSSDSRTNNLQGPPEKGFNVDVVDVFPGTPDHDDTYNKRVGAANVNEKPAFVRLLVVPVIVIDGVNPGDKPTLLPAVFGTDIHMESPNFADWIDGGDGYFYYKHILPGKTSTDSGAAPATQVPGMTYLDNNLFDQVTIDAGLLSQYPDAHVVIEVKVEGVGIRPASEYIDSWWKGVVPATGTPLWDVYDALQTALGL
jgi:hypothetical protein